MRTFRNLSGLYVYIPLSLVFLYFPMNMLLALRFSFICSINKHLQGTIQEMHLHAFLLKSRKWFYYPICSDRLWSRVYLCFNKLNVFTMNGHFDYGFKSIQVVNEPVLHWVMHLLECVWALSFLISIHFLLFIDYSIICLRIIGILQPLTPQSRAKLRLWRWLWITD